MLTRKCDICKKEIKERGPRVDITIGWESKQLHRDCAKPVIDFAIKKKLFTIEEINKIFQ